MSTILKNFLIMVTIYRDGRQFDNIYIKAEHTGNWSIHLKTFNDMLPFLAAAGHNLYVKRIYLYLQKMLSLKNDHPNVQRLLMLC